MSEVATTGVEVLKQPQYVEETTEGTTPTASPTFANCGSNTSIAIKKDGAFVEISQLGSEDLMTLVQGLKTNEIQLVTQIQNTNFITYGIDAANPGTPTGTISASLTILFSFYLNGSEQFVLCKGSRIKQVAFKYAMGQAQVYTIDIECMTITAPAAHGLTTPSFASLPTGEVLHHLSGGANPINWDGDGLNATEFNVTINRNTKAIHILGAAEPYGTKPHGRRIAGDFSVLETNTSIEADYNANPQVAKTLIVTIDSGVTLTFSNCKLGTYNRDHDSASDEPTLEKPTFMATAVTTA